MRADCSWGAVVFRQSSHSPAVVEFLLVQLASGGHWDHPKGHPEKGEGPMDTARREVGEEGGVLVDFLDGFECRAEWTLPDGRPKKVGYFLARQSGSRACGGPEGEILAREWLPYSAAMKRITYQSGRDVLKKAAEFLEAGNYFQGILAR